MTAKLRVYTCLAFCLFLSTALSWNCFSVFANYYLCSACWRPIAIGNKLIKISMSQLLSQSLCLCDLLLFANGEFQVAFLARCIWRCFFSRSLSQSLSSLTSVQVQTLQCQWYGWMSSTCCTCQTPLCSATVTSQSPGHMEHIDFHHTIKTSSLYWCVLCLMPHQCRSHIHHTQPQLPVTNIIHF